MVWTHPDSHPRTKWGANLVTLAAVLLLGGVIYVASRWGGGDLGEALATAEVFFWLTVAALVVLVAGIVVLRSVRDIR